MRRLLERLMVGAVCIPLVVGPAGLTSCRTVKTPQEQAELAVLDTEIDAMEASLDKMAESARFLFERAKTALESGNQALYDAAVASLRDLDTQWDQLLEARETKVQRTLDIEGQAAARPVTLFGSLLATFVPGAQLATEVLAATGLIAAGGAAVSPRGRKHLVKGLGYATKGQIGGLLVQLARTAGWAHSTPVTAALVRNEEASEKATAAAKAAGVAAAKANGGAAPA